MAERDHPETDPLDPSEINLQSIFNDALGAVVKREPKPVVEASFYPYAGLSSTIRLRRGRVYVRVSDVLRHSPREVLYALACILVSKLYRLKVSKEHERTYRQHTLNPSILDASEDARRKRGYKITTTPRGKLYDLESLFDELNDLYFAGALARPKISWSARRARRVLGHHDHIHGAIIISRLLDSPRIPRFVLEYVLFHEMLHIKHPARVVEGRTIYHSRDFRKDERMFGRYEEALGWLEKISPPARPRRRR